MIRKKTLFFIIIISGILLQSCSSIMNRGIGSSKDDAFSGESLVRYNRERKKQILNNPKSRFHNVLACHNREYKKGLDGLRSNYKTRKDDPDYWNHIGTCYYLKSNYLKADFYYKLAIATASKKGQQYPSATNNLGVISLKQGHIQESFDYFKKAIKQTPELLSPKFNLAQLYLQFNHLYHAQKLLAPLYRKSSSDIDVSYSLGSLYLQKNDIKVALNAFMEINKKLRTRTDIATNIAISQFLLNDHQSAKKTVNKMQLSGSFPHAKIMVRELRKQINIKESEIKRLNDLKNKTKNLAPKKTK